MKKVSFVRWDRQYKNLKREIDKAVLNCFKKGQFIQREECDKFEKSIRELTGTKYAIGLNSGTDALFLSLKAAGIGKGDEVITTSWTFIATIASIYQTGATPILIDVKEDNYLMDVDKLEMAITSRTKAIIPVHFNGQVCEMDRILEIAKNYNLIVIEDAAQAFSQEYKGKKAGSMGLTGCFSFYPSKLIGAAGDAGAVITNDPTIYSRIRLLQDHGRITKTETSCFGWNSRLDNIQAAVINVKIKHLKETKRRRAEIARQYKEGIKSIDGLKMVLPDNCENFVMAVAANKRDELRSFLYKQGIETQIHEPVPYHKVQSLHLDFSLPVTEKLAKEVITLPLNPELLDNEVKYIISKLKEFYSPQK